MHVKPHGEEQWQVDCHRISSKLSFDFQLWHGHCHSWNTSFNSSSVSFISPKANGWGVGTSFYRQQSVTVSWCCSDPIQHLQQPTSTLLSSEPYMAHVGTQKTYFSGIRSLEVITQSHKDLAFQKGTRVQLGHKLTSSCQILKKLPAGCGTDVLKEPGV